MITIEYKKMFKDFFLAQKFGKPVSMLEQFVKVGQCNCINIYAHKEITIKQRSTVIVGSQDPQIKISYPVDECFPVVHCLAVYTPESIVNEFGSPTHADCTIFTDVQPSSLYSGFIDKFPLTSSWDDYYIVRPGDLIAVVVFSPLVLFDVDIKEIL